MKVGKVSGWSLSLLRYTLFIEPAQGKSYAKTQRRSPPALGSAGRWSRSNAPNASAASSRPKRCGVFATQLLGKHVPAMAKIRSRPAFACFSFWLIESLMFDPSIHATSCLVQLHGLQSGTGVSPLSCFDFLPPRYPRAEFSGSMCPPLQRGPVWCQRGLSRDGHVPTALAFRPKTLTMLGYSSPRSERCGARDVEANELRPK